MLACIQRQQNLSTSSQHLNCTPKSLDVLTPPLLLPARQKQPCTHTDEPPSVASRYPSPAELDAFAKKIANNPLSIKIFQSDIRVPQHKQLSKMVNGLDTTGQCYSPYSQPYYQGLLAIGKAAVAATAVKGVVKNSEGKRTKHTNSQTCMAPYKTLNNGYSVRHKAYHVSSCKPPDVPVETVCSSTGDPSLLPRPELAEVQSLMRQMRRVPRGPGVAPPQCGGEVAAAAVAAVAHSDYVGVPPPQSSMAFSGAVVPTQSAAHVGDYTAWQPRHQVAQQTYQMRMYGIGAVGQSPESCLPLPSTYGLHPPNVGQERLAAMQGHFSVRHFFTPLWDSVAATPNSDCYTPQVLATGTMAPQHPRLHSNHYQTHFQPTPLLAHPQVYSADQNLCCGPPGASLCHAAALSRSLQSLECLISEIHPPCIKESMLGRGYEAAGAMQQHHHQPHLHAHIQLPVYR
ncbi:protein FAM222A [Dunckerocampus dactyliophorus]|uniref:protein FAM222A n=1 Tax=Dunckerocampus dactyliophorus TaxID=161453 RepID=UPI0024071E71|nr:protein FAM222A [Dunckerocampus dactyliophorus]XP_054613761.1 protein FAM222A [Dunckerocampus dactyliophorus]